jgi:hypothetical protein
MRNGMAEDEIEFYFEKSHFFRVVHVDGVVGGLSPDNRLIHMSVFSERAPVPKKTVHSIIDGVLGREILERREGKPGAFREVEVDLVLSLDTAVALRTWLDDKIGDIRQAQGPTDAPK